MNEVKMKVEGWKAAGPSKRNCSVVKFFVRMRGGGWSAGKWKCASRNTAESRSLKTYRRGGRSRNAGRGLFECPGRGSGWAVGNKCWRAVVVHGKAAAAISSDHRHGNVAQSRAD